MLMKHIHWSNVLILTFVLGVTACQEKKKSSSSSSSSTVYTTGGFTSGGYTTGGSTTGTTTGGTSASTTGGGTTTGTVTGGSSSAYAVTVTMSGNGSSCSAVNPSAPCDSWFMGMVPSTYNSSSHPLSEFIPLNSSNIAFFAADAYFKVRATVMPQPQISNTTNSAYCWDRLRPTSQSAIYQKVQFQLGIRDITRTSGGSYVIWDRYAIASSGVLTVNSQLIFDFSPRLNATRPDGTEVVGYSVDIFDVQSDSNCQGTNPGCVTSLVKEGSCWSVKLELANDVNRPF